MIEGLFGPVRRLYKRVCEFSHDRTPELHDRLARRPFAFLADCAERLSQQLSRSLGVRLRPTDILIDAPPVHREVEFDVQIYFPKEDAYRPFHEVSPVVEALARKQFDDQVKRVRIFAHPEWSAQIAGARRCRRISNGSSTTRDSRLRDMPAIRLAGKRGALC